MLFNTDANQGMSDLPWPHSIPIRLKLSQASSNDYSLNCIYHGELKKKKAIDAKIEYRKYC